ncbi:hypothetical protein [Hankyongella ginsenosidimutans]|uniref:hypothetical protein n=1 Tax=Hankyongella ginsenosidimutans TaxID=1763828 RepID=UPI001CA317F9|nr:hypothetical protein [Hankyongella ginsenosidimutans]
MQGLSTPHGTGLTQGMRMHQTTTRQAGVSGRIALVEFGRGVAALLVLLVHAGA